MDESFIIVGIIGIIFFLIAEFFGRAKHIGRGWTFILLFCALIPGLIALVSSPSAKREPTKGSRSHKIFGYILIILVVINLFRLGDLTFDMISVMPMLFVIGLYLVKLSQGEVVNRSPKFYFSSRNYSYVSKNTSDSTTQGNSQNSVKFSYNKSLEDLNNLRSKALLTETEYISAVEKLNSLKTNKQLKEIDEFQQLKDLYTNGLLTEIEFNNKVQILKDKLKY